MIETNILQARTHDDVLVSAFDKTFIKPNAHATCCTPLWGVRSFRTSCLRLVIIHPARINNFRRQARHPSDCRQALGSHLEPTAFSASSLLLRLRFRCKSACDSLRSTVVPIATIGTFVLPRHQPRLSLSIRCLTSEPEPLKFGPMSYPRFPSHFRSRLLDLEPDAQLTSAPSVAWQPSRLHGRKGCGITLPFHRLFKVG